MVSQGPLNLTLPKDLSDFVRGRMASGRFGSPEDVIRAALALLSVDGGGDDAATIRAKIDEAWQARGEKAIDGTEALQRWKSRDGRGTPQ